MGDNILRTL